MLDPDDWVLADKRNLNEGTLPRAFRLYPNFPNPFNPETTYSFDLTERTNVSLVVYNLLGEEVARLVQGRLDAGHHEVQWNGRLASGMNAPTGMYLCELAGNTHRAVIKLAIVR